MTTDFRALCAELHAAFNTYAVDEVHHALLERARAELAKPEPEGPTLAELDDLCAEHGFHYEDGDSLKCLLLIIADALARWGTPNLAETRKSLVEPADAEAADLVKWLWDAAEQAAAADWLDDAQHLNRAAALLSHLSPPQPIPVKERLPGPEDCDEQGRCWLLTVEDDYPQWRLHSIQGAQPGGAMIWVPVDSDSGVMVDCFYTSHWLPAHALPVPTHTSENV